MACLDLSFSVPKKVLFARIDHVFFRRSLFLEVATLHEGWSGGDQG